MPRRTRGLSKSEKDLSQLIGEIYNCALDPECWETTLENIANFVNGAHGQFLVRDKSSLLPVIATTARLNPDAPPLYLSHYYSLDPWIQRARHHSPAGTTIRGVDLVPFDELTKTVFYNDFLRLYEGAHMIVTVTASTDTLYGHATFCRGEKQGEFEDEDVQRLGLLMPHLQRASEIALKLSGTAASALGLAAISDLMTDGVILLDERSEIIGLNRAAQQILESADGFSYTRGAFRGADARYTVRLRTLVAGVVSGQNSPNWDSGGTLQLARPSGKAAYIVMICPMPPVSLEWCLSRPAAAIFITDPERQPKLPADALRQSFELTPAEARFAEAFVQETNVKAAAHRLSITEGTARIYLKRIFVKTGTHSQVALVKLFLSRMRVDQPTPNGRSERNLDL